MAHAEMSFTTLAANVGHDISVVSKAVNHGKFPRVIRKVREALNV